MAESHAKPSLAANALEVGLATGPACTTPLKIMTTRKTMTTALDYRHVLPAKKNMRQSDNILAHLAVLSMWAIIGLVLTALMFALGFGPEVVQALALAG